MCTSQGPHHGSAAPIEDEAERHVAYRTTVHASDEEEAVQQLLAPVLTLAANARHASKACFYVVNVLTVALEWALENR